MRTIDLTSSDAEPLAFDERFPLPHGCGGEDIVSPGEARVTGTLELASRGFLLHGSVEGESVLRCVRCLCEFTFPVRERFDLHLLPIAGAPAEDEARLGRDDLEVRFYSEPQVDLLDVAAEQIELALPIKPLCSKDCKGLCPQCGINLNQETCTCTPVPDERFAPLLSWREGTQKS